MDAVSCESPGMLSMAISEIPIGGVKVSILTKSTSEALKMLGVRRAQSEQRLPFKGLLA